MQTIQVVYDNDTHKTLACHNAHSGTGEKESQNSRRGQWVRRGSRGAVGLAKDFHERMLRRLIDIHIRSYSFIFIYHSFILMLIIFWLYFRYGLIIMSAYGFDVIIFEYDDTVCVELFLQLILQWIPEVWVSVFGLSLFGVCVGWF